MLAVRDVAEEAEAQVPAQGDDVQEPAAEEVVTEVVQPTPTPPSPPSPVIPSLPPHQPPCLPQLQDAAVPSLLFQQVLDTCSALSRRVECLENDKAAQQLEIVKLKVRVKKLEKLNKVKSSKLRQLKKVGTSQRVESSDDMENVFNQGRMIADMDMNEGIELVKDAEVLSMQEDDTEVQKAIEIVTTTKLMTEVVTAAATQVVAASTPIPAAKPKILNIATAPAVSTRRRKRVVIRDPEEELSFDTPAKTPKVKDKGKRILIEAPKPMKKKDQIEMDAKCARKLQEEISKEHEETYKNIDWNAALDHVQSKEPQYIKRYHGMKKKPQAESEVCKNMIFYLKNTEGYKLDFFKGMKEEMEEEDEEIIKSINETLAQKVTKRRKLHEQAKEDEDLKNQLEVVDDEDDDVFIEATPIGIMVPVVDYEIVMINNKPRYKIIKEWLGKRDDFGRENLLKAQIRRIFLDGYDKMINLPSLAYSTLQRLGLADGTESYPIGIVRDVEVYVGKLIFLEDFYVIDMEKGPTYLLLVGRGLLATASSIIDCKKSKIAVGEGITREWEIAKHEELNPFKDVLVFRKMVDFLGAILIKLKGNMWESKDMIEKKLDWNKPPKEGDGAWYIKIELIDPDGENFDRVF
nr:hypothetical protein [Tanacetum cinerariifolium]